MGGRAGGGGGEGGWRWDKGRWGVGKGVGEVVEGLTKVCCDGSTLFMLSFLIHMSTP